MVDEKRGVAEDTKTHQLLSLASKKTKDIMAGLIFGVVALKK